MEETMDIDKKEKRKGKIGFSSKGKGGQMEETMDIDRKKKSDGKILHQISYSP